uniref:Uncharacterized protein n=1 Tax=Arundo donax TaxID=35708 RepID=A0A0A8XQN0_ARUDO
MAHHLPVMETTQCSVEPSLVILPKWLMLNSLS